MDLRDKTALVTGGAHRVGKAIVLALAEAGANVVINYHSSAEAARETEAQVRAMGVDALAISADVSDHAQVRAMVEAAVTRFGAVDILVNSASHFEMTPFPAEDTVAWHRVTDILIHGPYYCANAVAPLMLARGEGVIVNIVDLYAFEPRLGYAAHTVGKTALLALTRQLAVDLAPTVRVNAVAPGLILPPPGSSSERAAKFATQTLLGRWGAPRDVADAVMYIVRSDYVDAEVIVVDGGERHGRYRGL
jgi:3-oxoacyl-[acyl-carrier protein] reductase/pteridine reductase